MRDYKELIEALRGFANSYVQMFGEDECSKLMNDASDAIEELQQNIGQYKLYLQDAVNDLRSAHEKEQRWHPVSEKPTRKNPTHARDTFLVRLESGCIKTLTYEYDNSDRCRPGMSPLFDEGWGETVVPVTHWMELPLFEPPKEEDK